MKNMKNIVLGLMLGFGATVFAQGAIFPDVQMSDWFAPERKTLPTVMNLEVNNTNALPAECPAEWEEIGLNRVYNLDDTNFRRTCITDQVCKVLYLEDRTVAPDCPTDWAEAQYRELNRRSLRRTCYICE